MYFLCFYFQVARISLIIICVGLKYICWWKQHQHYGAHTSGIEGVAKNMLDFFKWDPKALRAPWEGENLFQTPKYPVCSH